MSVISRIIPGKTQNNGINDQSIPAYQVSSPTSPLHLPVVTGVFPKGALAKDVGTVWINTADFTSTFGDIFSDVNGPYYNPTSLLIQQLIRGGQSTIGVRRVSANDEVARTALSAFVQKTRVPEYKRELSGAFSRDKDGNKIPTGKMIDTGVSVVIKPDPEAKTKAPGELTRREIEGVPANGDTPAVEPIFVFPLFEAICGVGEEYNRGGLQAGVRGDAQAFRNVAEFVKATGVYPFQLKMFTETLAGIRSYAKTADRRETVDFTLFGTTYKGTDYSITRGFGEFTGTNVNRKVVPRPAPYNSVMVYEESLTALMQTLYAVEKPHNEGLLEVGHLHYQQMNPFTLVDHNGAPYKAIVAGDVNMTWDLTGAVRATGGVLPFYGKDGQLPAFVEKKKLDDPLGLLAAARFPITRQEAWDVTNGLLAADMAEYLAGTETKNYTRNRQSFWWDVGYAQPVKDLGIQLLASRKDIIVVADATVWEPGRANTLNEVYSRSASLVNAIRMYPESEKWGTAACRAAINLIEAKVIDEKTGDFFSMNLDLAYAFALFAGNSEGIIKPAFSPDSKDNRVLRTMHSPNIEFEEDYTSANNFDNGALTLRVKDADQLFRPALVTVYNNADSVLKDLVTAFLCVCIEKIAQDEWNNVSGDTTLSSSSYVSNFKDGAERKCRDRLGGIPRQITFEASYNETAPGGRAIMNTIGNAYFNKGKYMMNLDLFAYNEQDLA